MRQTVEIRIRGIVQGVGFRPVVWRLAREEGLLGEVFNDGFGVLIHATGHAAVIARFVERLQAEAPPLSQIEALETQCLEDGPDFTEFRIAESIAGAHGTHISPDAAICAACRAEVLDPGERRFGYPFVNCTHCGPRFSIATEVPWDRVHTTMAAFFMCPNCAREYHDPTDRRFHAQPIACAVCGPSIWLEHAGSAAARNDSSAADVLSAARELLNAGSVVAIRGLGGFHLACDATNAEAVRRLRDRKQRCGKPFALMARDPDIVRRYCSLTPAATDLLQSPEAPIVLLKADGPQTLPQDIAPGLSTAGFMLPCTPLHLLLMQQIDHPLVMTSGNMSNEPQIISPEEARGRLGGLADAMLMHNREIANRIDDSVVGIAAGAPRLIRRARGYVPGAVPLPPGFEDAPDVLAYGAELKNTFCLLKGGAAILSQHQGDLADAATFDDYLKNLQLYTRMYDHRPRLLAADLHPEYLSTKLAKQQARDDRPLQEIQHHHAHIASCMAENGVALDAPPVLGIALDGLGFGDDGTFWGGEFLLADYCSYRRLAAFRPVAMPGGAQAIREPWRNTYAHLVAGPGRAHFTERFSDLQLFDYLSTRPLRAIDRMLELGINVPLASSCGRLFDAVAAALGLRPDRALFEGQGAMELEALAGTSVAEFPYSFTIRKHSVSGLLYLEPTAMWQELLMDLSQKIPLAQIAARFHHGLATAIRDVVAYLRGAGREFNTVVLSGGCFQNRLLLEELVGFLEADGWNCLLHARVPANDGGLALGQAVIAAARYISCSDQVDSGDPEIRPRQGTGDGEPTNHAGEQER